MSLFKKVIQSSRLEEFQEMIIKALERGYIVTSLSDWYARGFYPGKKVVLLRHDVDLDTEGAFKMFSIEKALGVKSTYYYRWSTIDESTMHKMNDSGFEVSLHYESLATLCRQLNIKKAEQVHTEILKKAANNLMKELDDFTNRFWSVVSICSHGDKRNQVLNIRNNVLLEFMDRTVLKEKYGMLFEAYDPDILNRISAYMSDSSAKYDHAWTNDTNPYKAVDEGQRVICILTHPQHWNYSLSAKLKKIRNDINDLYFQ